MAELVDALGSGPSGGNTVEVRVLFWAPARVSRFTQGKGTGARSVPERTLAEARDLRDEARYKAQWRIAAERMKIRSEHVVPLSTQAIEVVRELQKLYDGRRYVFGNQANHEKPMRENTLVLSEIG